MKASKTDKPLVGILMGSDSDWPTMKAAADALGEFGIASEARVISAHRDPHGLEEYAGSADHRGLRVIIAGAGGAAHLPGVTAAFTTLPVIGVPIESKSLRVSTRCYPSCKCRRACRWPPSASARPKMPGCSRCKSWPWATRDCKRRWPASSKSSPRNHGQRTKRWRNSRIFSGKVRGPPTVPGCPLQFSRLFSVVVRARG